MLSTLTNTSRKSPWAENTDPSEFCATAPLGYEGGDTNLRRYVGNRPVDATDPSGLEIQFDFSDPASKFTAKERKTLKEKFIALLQGVSDLDPTGPAGALARQALDPKGQLLKVVFKKGWGIPVGRWKDGEKAPDLILDPTQKGFCPDADNVGRWNYVHDDGSRLTEEEIAQIVTVHEMAHAFLRLRDPHPRFGDRGGGVMYVENAFREILEVRKRTSYDGIKCPDTIEAFEQRKIDTIIKKYSGKKDE